MFTFFNLSHHSCIMATFLYRKHFISSFYDENSINCIQILCAKTKLFRKWDLKEDRLLINSFFLTFQLLLILIRGIVTSIKKKLRWKSSPWHVFECLSMRWILSCQKWPKKWSFRLFIHNLPQLGLFDPYFVCKWSFRVISMLKIVILDQSKPITQILKNKKSKIQKCKICKLNVYYL